MLSALGVCMSIWSRSFGTQVEDCYLSSLKIVWLLFLVVFVDILILFSFLYLKRIGLKSFQCINREGRLGIHVSCHWDIGLGTCLQEFSSW